MIVSYLDLCPCETKTTCTRQKHLKTLAVILGSNFGCFSLGKWDSTPRQNWRTKLEKDWECQAGLNHGWERTHGDPDMFYSIKVTRHISRYVLSSDRLEVPRCHGGSWESGLWPPEECSRGAGAPGARNAQNLGQHETDGASGSLRVAQCSTAM